jgi:hypothetical protein
MVEYGSVCTAFMDKLWEALTVRHIVVEVGGIDSTTYGEIGKEALIHNKGVIT